MSNDIEYYVALDLGSESLAACFEKKSTGEGGMVQLQAFAEKLLDSGSPPELLQENGKPSPRLRTRIALEENRQPAELPPEHARLEFVDLEGCKQEDYERSLFSYFYVADQELSRTILPNPKIPFQEGGAEIIPEVVTDNRSKVRHHPDQLLGHLTVQVIRNFVLRSPQLRDIPPQQIHLTLTVPNVYSFIHVKNLLDFVKANVDVGGLDYLYESDAVAYLFIDAPKGSGEKEVEEFKEAIVRRPNQRLLRIVTIDIGRGTTDLSLVQIEEPLQAGKRGHFVLARTGKSDGGNRLSYLLAEYYDDVVASVFVALGKERPFSFLEGEGQIGQDQGLVIGELEKLIENIKANITEDYRIGLTADAQRQLMAPAIDALLKVIDPAWGSGGILSVDGLEHLRSELLAALVLPPRLPGHAWCWLLSVKPFNSFLAGFWGPERLVRHRRLLRLAEAIRAYVNDNVVHLIDQLRGMAEARENVVAGKRHPKTAGGIFDNKNTFVVIAGQGSQFGPIQAAVRRYFSKARMTANNLFQLRNTDAKEACCRGAVHYQRARVERMNPSELHGSYGFLNTAPIGREDLYRNADMRRIGQGGRDVITFNAESEYWLIYSPRPKITLDEPPRLHDGTTAVICVFEGREFDIEYDPEAPAIRVNDVDVKVLANYGSANESIYPKVWPEAVRPVEKN